MHVAMSSFISITPLHKYDPPQNYMCALYDQLYIVAANNILVKQYVQPTPSF